jgi:hypothetical protein
MTTVTASTTTTDAVSAALSDAQTQMGRVDSKASMLLAGSLTSVSVGVALIAKTDVSAITAVSAILTVSTVALAVALLITAVRPTLRGNYGFVRWATAPSATALLNTLEHTDSEHSVEQARQLLCLSRSLYRKYRLVRLATDLLRSALVLAVLTALLTVI